MPDISKEELLMEFKTLVQASFPELFASVSGEKDVVLTNKAIYIDNRIEIPLRDIKKVEFLYGGNLYTLVIDYTNIEPEINKWGKIRIKESFFSHNIKGMYNKLQTLIPNAEFSSKFNRREIINGLIVYASVLIMGFAALRNIHDRSLWPIIVLLIFATLVVLLGVVPLEFDKPPKRIYRITGIITVSLFILLISVIIYKVFL